MLHRHAEAHRRRFVSHKIGSMHKACANRRVEHHRHSRSFTIKRQLARKARDNEAVKVKGERHHAGQRQCHERRTYPTDNESKRRGHAIFCALRQLCLFRLKLVRLAHALLPFTAHLLLRLCQLTTRRFAQMVSERRVRLRAAPPHSDASCTFDLFAKRNKSATRHQRCALNASSPIADSAQRMHEAKQTRPAHYCLV